MTVGALLGAARREAPASLAALAIGAAIVAVAVLFQVGALGGAEVLRGTPDLVVVAVAGIGLVRGPVPGAAAGFAAGLAIDALELGVLGSTSIALVIAGYATGLFGERLPRRAVVRPLLAVMAAAIGAGIIELLVAALLGGAPADPVAALVATLAGGLVEVPLAIVLLPLIRRVLGRPERQAPLTASLVPTAEPVDPALVGPPAIVLEAERRLGPRPDAEAPR